ncbi:transposase [Brucepastera parasyntrophica]|uniref:transposase n=1 Tax=Brucepastera parasyntrophica TaxID=2880008 RepID=UPI00210D376D|nr:transposase [Brucepastera parasyntrophica]ULQ58600.1 transposase [Brucepastera parasyntrophica]ULQ59483.1 transposase [Brucepastera parasyntrophica]
MIFAELLEKELKTTEEQLKELERIIENNVKGHELAPYVMSIPGVGIGVAAAFLAYVGDGSRFSKASEIANYVGLVPRIDCSGETNRYGNITKEGCRALRRVILQSVWSLVRCKEGGGRLQAKFFALNERMGKTKSAVAIARRMVTLMWILVRRKEFYADISTEQLKRKFRYYHIHYEGWESKIA